MGGYPPYHMGDIVMLWNEYKFWCKWNKLKVSNLNNFITFMEVTNE